MANEGYFLMFGTIPLFIAFGLLVEESKQWASGHKTKYIISIPSIISAIIVMFGLGVTHL